MNALAAKIAFLKNEARKIQSLDSKSLMIITVTCWFIMIQALKQEWWVHYQFVNSYPRLFGFRCQVSGAS